MSTLKADSIQPTNSGNILIFKTGAGDAERMRIDTSGNVGIGTASPAVALDVNGEARSSTSTTSSSNAKTLVTKDYTDNRLAFAWVVFRDPAGDNPGGNYGSSTNCTIISGKNVSSVVRKVGGVSPGSAWYELTFTEPCVDANYCATGSFIRRYAATTTGDAGWPLYMWPIPPYDAASGYRYYQQPSESGEAIPAGAISPTAGSLAAPSTKQVFRFHASQAHASNVVLTIDVCRIGMVAIYR